MMDEIPSNIILSIFERKGGNGQYTLPFEHLDAEAQSIVMDQAILTAEEVPVLVSFKSPDEWLMLTTQRLIQIASGEKIGLNFNEIASVTVDPDSPDLSMRRQKQYWNRLKIGTFNEVYYTVEVESGMPFWGLWNALKYIATRNWRLAAR
jgi:hypothetical protein